MQLKILKVIFKKNNNNNNNKRLNRVWEIPPFPYPPHPI